MPTASRRPCPEPGCATITQGGRCDLHRKQHRKGTGSRRFADVYRSRQWQRLSARVLMEEPWCRVCGERSEQADHIVAMNDGGAPLDRANVQGLCRRCHARKTGLDLRRRNARGRGGQNL
jgi:5-methylcytosine-specific restriction protein A